MKRLSLQYHQTWMAISIGYCDGTFHVVFGPYAVTYRIKGKPAQTITQHLTCTFCGTEKVLAYEDQTGFRNWMRILWADSEGNPERWVGCPECFPSTSRVELFINSEPVFGWNIPKSKSN